MLLCDFNIPSYVNLNSCKNITAHIILPVNVDTFTCSCVVTSKICSARIMSKNI